MEKITLFLIMASVIFISGCTNDDYSGFIEEELGAFSFGPLINYTDDAIIRFEYDGNAIRIPYHVEGFAEGIASELGWFLLVDGLAQPTQLETIDGEILSELAFMHYFALEYREREEFYVVFSPISGEIGTNVGLIAGTLLRPNFMPTNIDESIFAPFHHLMTTFPAEVIINSDVQNSFTADTDVLFKPIMQNVMEAEKQQAEFEGMDFDEWMASRARIGIFPHDLEFQLNYEEIIIADDGEVNLFLFVYGGKEITSRITFFVNHEPVQVNGADFIEIEMEHDKLALIDVNLSLDELNDLNSLYALMMATGDNYYDEDIYKTWTLLLVNESYRR